MTIDAGGRPAPTPEPSATPTAQESIPQQRVSELIEKVFVSLPSPVARPLAKVIPMPTGAERERLLARARERKRRARETQQYREGFRLGYAKAMKLVRQMAPAAVRDQILAVLAEQAPSEQRRRSGGAA